MVITFQGIPHLDISQSRRRVLLKDWTSFLTDPSCQKEGPPSCLSPVNRIVHMTENINFSSSVAELQY